MRDVHHWSTPSDYWHDTAFFPSRSVAGTRHIVLIIQHTNTPMLFSLSPRVVVRLRQCSSEHPPWAGLPLTPNPIWHIERDSGPALVQKWTVSCSAVHLTPSTLSSCPPWWSLVWSQGLGGYRLKPESWSTTCKATLLLPLFKPVLIHLCCEAFHPAFVYLLSVGLFAWIAFRWIIKYVSVTCIYITVHAGLLLQEQHVTAEGRQRFVCFFVKSILRRQKLIPNFSSNINFFNFIFNET